MKSQDYLDELWVLLSEFRGYLGHSTLDIFAAGLPESIGEIRDCPPRTLPVLAHFDAAVRSSPPASRALLEHLFKFRGSLFWGQTYSAEDFGADFLKSYGWSEFAGPRGPIPSQSTACGILFLGPEYEISAACPSGGRDLCGSFRNRPLEDGRQGLGCAPTFRDHPP